MQSVVRPLDGDLKETRLNSQTTQDIRHSLWPESSSERSGIFVLDWKPYFDYYKDQCQHALQQQGTHILVRTHQHIVDIAARLKAGQSRAEISLGLKNLFTGREKLHNEDEVLRNSIDLAARLCSMVNVGKNTSTVTRCEKLFWDASSLSEFLRSHFDALRVPRHQNVRFDGTFVAVNLERVAGIKICWTNNLADHLRIVDYDEKIVVIFHHASFLERQRDSPLFPPGLISETLRTLALLFPRHDKRTKSWLLAQHSSSGSKVDRHLSDCGRLRLDDRELEMFEFWHHRLFELKQAFDHARPTKWPQWWYDRRDGHGWYTFWVAVYVLFLTIFFGVIQSIEGALQVYKAYHPTNV